MGDTPKVNFAVGKKVTTSFFKSSYARNVMTTCRDSESLECNLVQNVRENTALRHWQICAPMEVTKPDNDPENDFEAGDWRRIVSSVTGAFELDNLRKQCNFLMEENRKLQNTVMNAHEIEKQFVDAVCLQSKVEALQWELKEMGRNSRVYRSLLTDVAIFLERTFKSLMILQEKNDSKDKNSASRAPRSRSAHGDTPPKTPTKSSPPSLPSSCSRFARAKSVTRSSPSTSSNRDCTWSMLRKNEATHSASPRKSQDKKIDGVAYRRPVQLELNFNEVPADKLSEEAFRLWRTVRSLLLTREPQLNSTSPIENSDSSPSPTEHQNDGPLSLQNSFVDAAVFIRRLSSERSNESSSTDNDSRGGFTKSMNDSRVSFSKSPNDGQVSFAKSPNDAKRNLHNFYPGMRRSLDANSLNSGSSKTTSEENALANNNPLNASMPDQGGMFTCTPAATPNTRVKKVGKKGKENSSKSKPTSESSVEDESGFSSLTSFQEVGLPLIRISPIRGYHTEIGLPVVPLDKGKQRRWSSTPAEIQAMINKQRNSFAAPETAKESLSVWV